MTFTKTFTVSFLSGFFSSNQMLLFAIMRTSNLVIKLLSFWLFEFLQAYLFNDYWEDIGTIKSFFDANLALTEQVALTFV